MQFSLDQFLAKIPQKYIETYSISVYSWDIERITFFTYGDEVNYFHLPVDDSVTIEIVSNIPNEYIIIEHPAKYILKLYDYGNLSFYIL